MGVELFAYKDGYAGTHFKEVRSATDEEIKDAHPKCGTCKHYERRSYTNNPTSSYCAMLDAYLGRNFYCRHHEPKEVT